MSTNSRIEHAGRARMCARTAAVLALVVLALSACSSTDSSSTSDLVVDPNPPVSEPVSVVVPNGGQQATVGVPFSYDATQNGAAFKDPRGGGLVYAVSFAPTANGLNATAGRISGVPNAAGVVTATIAATDILGRTATNSFAITVAAAPVAAPVALVSANAPQGATVGASFSYDATKAGAAFNGTGLSYAVAFTPSANGLSAANGRIVGAPTAAGTITVTIVATDAAGNVATNAFPIVAFSNDLVAPVLPAALLAYSDARAPLPRHYTQAAPNAGSPAGADNTPANNITSDAGATLGRVLFYDRRLSVNDRVSCASCHQQQFAFSDTARLSRGFAGASTGRHSMGLANARFYNRGRFFWDERAASLEAQVLLPIQDAAEMGMTLDLARTKLSLTSYYGPLFTAAFGTPEVTADRVSLALAQFVRSMVSTTSKFDQAFGPNGVPDFAGTFTAQELAGQTLYNGRAGCARCHGTNAHISDDIHNTGLDATITDVGAGGGRFKAPSLRNVAVRAPYMHDGRFSTLAQVIEFYNSGVQPNPNLDGRLQAGGGGRGGGAPAPLRLNLTQAEKDALVAFLGTFTDQQFLTDPRLANPFLR